MQLSGPPLVTQFIAINVGAVGRPRARRKVSGMNKLTTEFALPRSRARVRLFANQYVFNAAIRHEPEQRHQQVQTLSQRR
jgi:hypothetical protein